MTDCSVTETRFYTRKEPLNNVDIAILPPSFSDRMEKLFLEIDYCLNINWEENQLPS